MFNFDTSTDRSNMKATTTDEVRLYGICVVSAMRFYITAQIAEVLFAQLPYWYRRFYPKDLQSPMVLFNLDQPTIALGSLPKLLKYCWYDSVKNWLSCHNSELNGQLQHSTILLLSSSPPCTTLSGIGSVRPDSLRAWKPVCYPLRPTEDNWVCDEFISHSETS